MAPVPEGHFGPLWAHGDSEAQTRWRIRKCLCSSQQQKGKGMGVSSGEVVCGCCSKIARRSDNCMPAETPWATLLLIAACSTMYDLAGTIELGTHSLVVQRKSGQHGRTANERSGKTDGRQPGKVAVQRKGAQNRRTARMANTKSRSWPWTRAARRSRPGRCTSTRACCARPTIRAASGRVGRARVWPLLRRRWPSWPGSWSSRSSRS